MPKLELGNVYEIAVPRGCVRIERDRKESCFVTTRTGTHRVEVDIAQVLLDIAGDKAQKWSRNDAKPNHDAST